jgi:hypothetical protein
MANIQFSALVNDARNKQGGTVFSKVRYGAINRRKVSPVQPRTSYQTQVRSLFTLLSKTWATTLTAAQRAAWISLAESNTRKNVFGNNITLTGLQIYMALNRGLQTIGVATISDAPATLSVGAPGTVTLANAAGPPTTLTVDGGTEPGADDVPVIVAARPLNPGRRFVGNAYRVILATTAAGTAGPWDIKAAYVAKFGAQPVGVNISVGVYYVNNVTGAKSLSATGQIVLANAIS